MWGKFNYNFSEIKHHLKKAAKKHFLNGHIGVKIMNSILFKVFHTAYMNTGLTYYQGDLTQHPFTPMAHSR